MLINLDQSKGFDRVDHGFLETVFFFCGWIHLLYTRIMVEVNGVYDPVAVMVDCINYFIIWLG